MVFPMEVQCGSVIVKIYKVENKGRDSFTVSYFADGKRTLKMFAAFEEAHAEANSKTISLSRGELDVLHLASADRLYESIAALPGAVRGNDWVAGALGHDG